MTLSNSFIRDFYGAPGRVRTRDPLITNQVLYQLSYKGTSEWGSYQILPSCKEKIAATVRSGCRDFRVSPAHAAARCLSKSLFFLY